jgi:hypothetical protein
MCVLQFDTLLLYEGGLITQLKWLIERDAFTAILDHILCLTPHVFFLSAMLIIFYGHLLKAHSIYFRGIYVLLNYSRDKWS